MNRKLVLLNLLLGCLLIWLGMQLRDRWVESREREQAAMGRAAKAAAVTAPPAVPGVEIAQPAAYIDVAQRMLFSKDRDPNVLLDPPPVPPAAPPEKPVPPLPSYYGQMSLGEPVILLAAERAVQKSYHVGESVGDFKITAFDRETVTLEWNEKTLVNKLSDLVPKEAERPVQAAAAPAPAANPDRSITKMGAAPKSDPMLGPKNGDIATCVPEDKSPNGTIKDGYRKKIVNTLMGATCYWEPI